MFKLHLVTLFPELFPGPLAASVTGRGLESGLWQCATTDIRIFTTDKHRTVDDTPYGGGAGMVMRADVVAAAVRHARAQTPGAPVVYVTPTGKPLQQADAARWAQGGGLIVLCGHYEGIDQRVLDAEVDEEISVGDYVLSGGEIAVYPLADATLRLLPGVLGQAHSLSEESFDLHDQHGNLLLEYPHYTRPEVWEDRPVPEILKSGHHGNIAQWRQQQALARTLARRPDLLEKNKKS